MTVALNSKDIQVLDKVVAPNNSQVWDYLTQGAKDITASDFVGVNEVRVNDMKGFTASDYKRNQENGRAKLTMEKSTHKLKHEDWFAYDMDRLDQEENPTYVISTAVEEHRRLVTYPQRDKVAMETILKNATDNGIVENDVKTSNALAVFDDAEQYMIDEGVSAPYIMFVSSDYYKMLKEDTTNAHAFTVNETTNINGIDRRVGMLDGSIPVVKVSKDRMQVIDGVKVNFVLLPQNAVAPIVKYGTVDFIDASVDRDGYRDTVKGLDYYDALIFPNAKKTLYVSVAKGGKEKLKAARG